MGINILRFLRRAPAALRSYFDAIGIAVMETVDWEAPTPTLQRAILNALGSLEQAERDSVTIDLEHVEQLCNPTGQIKLLSLAAADTSLLTQVLAAESDEARAITILLGRRLLFDRALTLTYSERLLNGRSWSAFVAREPGTPRYDAERIGTLEREVSEIFARVDGSGRRLKIDAFEWQAFGGSSCLHYCIYAEGQPESHLEFHKDEPTRLTRRVVHERAIVYDPARGTLDVITSGGTAVRNEVAASFARNILHVRDGIQPVVARRFTLNRLKDRPEFDTDVVDGIKTVKVFLLRLAPVSGSGRVTIEIDPSDHTDIYTTGQQWFGDANPLRRPEWQVTQAKIRIVFEPESGSIREKRVTIDLRHPNHSNIREQIRHHQIVSQKYLERWRLVVQSAV